MLGYFQFFVLIPFILILISFNFYFNFSIFLVIRSINYFFTYLLFIYSADFFTIYPYYCVICRYFCAICRYYFYFTFIVLYCIYCFIFHLLFYISFIFLYCIYCFILHLLFYISFICFIFHLFVYISFICFIFHLFVLLHLLLYINTYKCINKEDSIKYIKYKHFVSTGDDKFFMMKSTIQLFNLNLLYTFSQTTIIKEFTSYHEHLALIYQYHKDMDILFFMYQPIEFDGFIEFIEKFMFWIEVRYWY